MIQVFNPKKAEGSFFWWSNLTPSAFLGLRNQFIFSVMAYRCNTKKKSYKVISSCYENGRLQRYDDMTNRKNFSNHPVNNDLRTYKNILKIATGQGDDYAIGCLLIYLYY